MQVEVFSLCDAATVDSVGKLNVLGAFDTIWAAKLPTFYPQCAIALRLRFEGLERGEHQVAVSFVDMDGKHIIPSANGAISINFPDDQRSGSANLVLNLQMLGLPQYGEYSIDVTVDATPMANLPLFIKQR
jgi:hypothetical protein